MDTKTRNAIIGFLVVFAIGLIIIIPNLETPVIYDEQISLKLEFSGNTFYDLKIPVVESNGQISNAVTTLDIIQSLPGNATASFKVIDVNNTKYLQITGEGKFLEIEGIKDLKTLGVASFNNFNNKLIFLNSTTPLTLTYSYRTQNPDTPTCDDIFNLINALPISQGWNTYNFNLNPVDACT